MTDSESKPATKVLSNKDLDHVQGGAKKLTTASSKNETEYKPKLTNASVKSFDLRGSG